jgi:hypothetical protein
MHRARAVPHGADDSASQTVWFCVVACCVVQSFVNCPIPTPRWLHELLQGESLTAGGSYR